MRTRPCSSILITAIATLSLFTPLYAIRITGTVVDSATSQSISGASVVLVENTAISTTTALNGTFTLTGTATRARFSPPTISKDNAALHARVQKNGLIIDNGNIGGVVSVEVFSGNGVCVYRKSIVIPASGTALFNDIPAARGICFARIQSANTELILPHFGLMNSGAASKTQPRESGSLNRASAAYTIRISKTGYLTKSVQVNGDTADAGTIRLVAEQEQTGVWVKVTPAGADPSDLSPSANSYGMGSIVGDPARPSDMYVGGSASGLWKSTDYGKTWTKINSTIPNIWRGTVIAVAGTTPATVWASGYHQIFKSTDGGYNFSATNINYDLYSLTVDPYDNNHLLSGLHEASGVVESTDGGATWQMRGTGTLNGGVSVYPFFINTGDSASTRRTWFAIGQNGSSPGRTTNGGATWTIPAGLTGLEHPHGNAQIFQKDSMLWVGGSNGPSGQGVYRSTNYGVSWARVDAGTKPEAIVWGSDKYVYAMYAWACSKCNLGTNFERAALPGGNSWSYLPEPSGLIIGPNTVAAAFNGTHWVFVGCMWSEGLWRYVEP